MPTRKISFVPDEYYHLYNRGTLKRLIFLDDRDYARFIFLLIYFQTDNSRSKEGDNLSRRASLFVRNRMSDIVPEEVMEISRNRIVELVAFCLMPNHFHLIIKEAKEGGISHYMQRILNSYTKYFNTKYQLSGHLFQGPFKSVHISDNNQLLHLSAYIHRNPRELKDWRGSESEYRWSSYQDYVKSNRWDTLLVREIILGQFKNGEDYHKFLGSSSAKSLEEEHLDADL
ncbi:MAG: transposase [Candidatus Vogelbacteria bacterium]|nr:transposase [Candidatus Vogelbacteria bacterium]